MSKKLSWVAGVFPAPEWIQKQDKWFIWADLNGDCWLQGTTNEGQPLAVIVPRGELIEYDEKKESWSFSGNPIRELAR